MMFCFHSLAIDCVKGCAQHFVTGLEFSPDSPLVNDQLHNEFALLSISADNACKVTTIRRRSMYDHVQCEWNFTSRLYALYSSKQPGEK